MRDGSEMRQLKSTITAKVPVLHSSGGYANINALRNELINESAGTPKRPARLNNGLRTQS